MGDDDGAEAPAPPPKKLKHELTLVLHPILPPLKKLTKRLVITEPFSADELSQLVRAATHEDGSTGVDVVKGGEWEKEKCVGLYYDPLNEPVDKKDDKKEDFVLVPLSVIAADPATWAEHTWYAADPHVAIKQKKVDATKKKADLELARAVAHVFAALVLHAVLTALISFVAATVAFGALGAALIYGGAERIQRAENWWTGFKKKPHVAYANKVWGNLGERRCRTRARRRPFHRRARRARAAHNPYKLAGLCLIPLLELHVEGLTPGALRTLSGSCSAVLKFLGGLFSFRVQPALRTLARSLYYNLPPNATSDEFARALPRVCEEITSYKQAHWEGNPAVCRELFFSNENDLLNDLLQLALVLAGFVGVVFAPLYQMNKDKGGLAFPWYANLLLVAGAVGAYMLQKHIRALSDFDFFVHAT